MLLVTFRRCNQSLRGTDLSAATSRVGSGAARNKRVAYTRGIIESITDNIEGRKDGWG